MEEQRCAIVLVRWIMARLPDKEYPKVVAAIDIKVEFARHGGKSPDLVRRLVYLVKHSPQCWGIHRAKVYWRIVFSILSREEALVLYLHQFPDRLSTIQFARLRLYIAAVFQLPEACVDDMVRGRNFQIYPQRRRREPIMSCC